MAVEETAESCGSHAAGGGSGVGAAVASGPATSSSSAAQACKQQHQHHKLEVYTEVLRRLHDSGMPEARAPGFDDELWSHFNRLPARCVLAPRPVNPALASSFSPRVGGLY
jgi:hypothetical protein